MECEGKMNLLVFSSSIFKISSLLNYAADIIMVDKGSDVLKGQGVFSIGVHDLRSTRENLK